MRSPHFLFLFSNSSEVLQSFSRSQLSSNEEQGNALDKSPAHLRSNTVMHMTNSHACTLLSI